MTNEDLIYQLHPLERKVLKYLDDKFLSKISDRAGLQEVEVTRAIQWLQSKKILNYSKLESREIVLDKLGEEYLEKGLPEIQILKVLTDEDISLDELKKNLDLDGQEINVSLGILKRKGLVYMSKDKRTNVMFLARTEVAGAFLQKYKNPLKIFKNPKNRNELSQDEMLVFQDLVKRKSLVKESVLKDIVIELTKDGKELIDYISSNDLKLDFVENLTSDMFKDQSWRGKVFRHYDVSSQVPFVSSGRRHPIYEANGILRSVFIEMGFQEMQGPMIESEFWCFDVLWIPQDHPAREDQDTFYVEGCKNIELPKDCVEGVRQMHEDGIKQSHTPKGQWSEQITKKRILRTHSTATSFRTLYELSKRYKSGEEINGKYFYNANNFRNEAVDATHLAEFFQAEGFIVGDDLSLANLMGFVKEFYSKLGIDKIRFKPTFNPYTEPSMEAHYFDEKMGKWYALINSGIFRQETLEPFGLGGKTVIAWGIGSNRVANLLADKSSMREITGYDCDFDWLRNRRIMKRDIVKNLND